MPRRAASLLHPRRNARRAATTCRPRPARRCDPACCSRACDQPQVVGGRVFQLRVRGVDVQRLVVVEGLRDRRRSAAAAAPPPPPPPPPPEVVTTVNPVASQLSCRPFRDSDSRLRAPRFIDARIPAPMTSVVASSLKAPAFDWLSEVRVVVAIGQFVVLVEEQRRTDARGIAHRHLAGELRRQDVELDPLETGAGGIDGLAAVHGRRRLAVFPSRHARLTPNPRPGSPKTRLPCTERSSRSLLTRSDVGCSAVGSKSSGRSKLSRS